jgi:hypothetical protein
MRFLTTGGWLLKAGFTRAISKCGKVRQPIQPEPLSPVPNRSIPLFDVPRKYSEMS